MEPARRSSRASWPKRSRRGDRLDFASAAYYVLFLPVILLAAWGARARRLHQAVLLGASYTFFWLASGAYVLLLVVSTLIDWIAADAISRRTNRMSRRVILVAALVANLALLGFYKYADLLLGSFHQAALLAGVDLGLSPLGILLPIGISFYTFQSMSYTIDVYRGMAPARNALEFALYVSFFPQLVAGPIVRASEFLPQLRERPRVGREDIQFGLLLIAFGAFKKLAIADNMELIVDQTLGDPGGGAAPLVVVIGVVAFAIQIYTDFSGYSDIAIGSARLFGYRLPDNFNFPYLAASLRDFWRRWHMTLSRWLRDYLYIPLGGSRQGVAKTRVALLLTMLLGGLWHGASWAFVLWGAIHGVFLGIERAIARSSWWNERPWRVGERVGPFVTLYVVLLAWIPFRIHDPGAMVHALRAFLWVPGWFVSPLVQVSDLVARTTGVTLPLLLLAAFIVLYPILRARDLRGVVLRRFPPAGYAAALAALALGAILLRPVDPTSFIYFRF